MGRWDVVVAVLSFAGIVSLFLLNSFALCALLWLPGLILLFVRATRRAPFRGDVL